MIYTCNFDKIHIKQALKKSTNGRRDYTANCLVKV